MTTIKDALILKETTTPATRTGYSSIYTINGKIKAVNGSGVDYELVANDSPVFTSSIILPKASGYGIKVDTTTPTFGWHDMLGAINTKGVGANNPTWSIYRSPLSGYQFGINDECWIEFHVPHDYVASSDVFIHVHWSHTSASVTSGGVTWTFNVSYAKSHNQAAFPTPISTSVTQTASTTQYQHMLAEVQLSATSPSASQIDSDDLEPDGVLLVHVELTGNTMSTANDPFLHFVDIHYQSTNISTKDKSPDFYT